MADYSEWKNNFIARAVEKKRKSTVEKLVCSSLDESALTNVQKRTLEKILKNEFKKSLAQEETKNLSRKLLEKSKESSKAKRINSRKERAHLLISIGALTDVINFPKDKGIIIGAYDYILNKAKNEPDFINSLKSKGDAILKERENSKN